MFNTLNVHGPGQHAALRKHVDRRDARRGDICLQLVGRQSGADLPCRPKQLLVSTLQPSVITGGSNPHFLQDSGAWDVKTIIKHKVLGHGLSKALINNRLMKPYIWQPEINYKKVRGESTKFNF
jgi:hypothetical protein